MNRFKKFATLAAALVLLSASGPISAHAQQAPTSSSTTGISDGVAPGDTAPDSWLGAAAAVGCGFFVRATIATGGAAVGTIAGAVACCAFMMLDALAEK
jgi:hypothetical protein